jgi:hypothetical protein
MNLKGSRRPHTFKKQSDFRDSHFRNSPKKYYFDLNPHFVAHEASLISLIDLSLCFFAVLWASDLVLVLG